MAWGSNLPSELGNAFKEERYAGLAKTRWCFKHGNKCFCNTVVAVLDVPTWIRRSGTRHSNVAEGYRRTTPWTCQPSKIKSRSEHPLKIIHAWSFSTKRDRKENTELSDDETQHQNNIRTNNKHQSEAHGSETQAAQSNRASIGEKTHLSRKNTATNSETVTSADQALCRSSPSAISILSIASLTEKKAKLTLETKQKSNRSSTQQSSRLWTGNCQQVVVWKAKGRKTVNSQSKAKVINNQRRSWKLLRTLESSQTNTNVPKWEVINTPGKHQAISQSKWLIQQARTHQQVQWLDHFRSITREESKRNV